MRDLVVIAGMSGAGRTQVGNALEDFGWFVIDNLPAPLIPKLAELVSGPRAQTDKVALVVGSSPATAEVVEAIEQLRVSGLSPRIVYLDASDDVLIRRYESTKRRHPHAEGLALPEAIARERGLLVHVRESADLVIDTSQMSIYDLRARIVDLFSDSRSADPMQTTVMSFGYKHGLPADVDLVFDCRFLPNPFWDEQLRPMCGLDDPVREYLHAQALTADFLERLRRLLELLVPAYRAEGKAYLTIALGCTGGQHRSVMIAEEVAQMLRDMGVDPRVTHRDVSR